MFPFSIPSKTKEFLEKLGILDQYDFNLLTVHEEQQQKVCCILTFHASRKILLDKEDTFNVTHDKSMKLITNGTRHFLCFDDAAVHDQDLSYITKVFYTDNHDKIILDVKQFFLKTHNI